MEGGVRAQVIPLTDSMVGAAAADSLPTEPLVQKALEGGAKHVSADRIVLAVRLRRDRLEAARALLVRAGDPPPVTPLKVTAVATALSRGVPAPTVERVVAGLPGEPHGAALQAVADLPAPKFDPHSSPHPILHPPPPALPPHPPRKAPAHHPRARGQARTRGKPPAKPARGKKGAKGHMKKPATAPLDTTKKP